MIYLASPYAHPDPEIMQSRFHSVAALTADLLKRGRVVYSPIAHNHYLAVQFDMPRSWDFWQTVDLPMLDLAEELYVLCLPGWQESKGVQAEIDHAQQRGIPIQYWSED